MDKTFTQKKLVKIRCQKTFPLSTTSGFEPGQNVINNILNYSKALSIRKSAMIENVEMILN